MRALSSLWFACTPCVWCVQVEDLKADLKLVESELEESRLEGEMRVERKVRSEFPCGQVQHFEGEKDAEQLVRIQWSDGTVEHV